MSDEELKKLSGGEVVAVIDDVLSRFEVELPGEVRAALVKAIQEIRLEDIKYREDYKVLVEEFELLALEKKELAEKIDSLETRLETLDNEYVNAKERVTDLQATLESAENERETALDRVKKDAEAARAVVKCGLNSPDTTHFREQGAVSLLPAGMDVLFLFF